MPIKPENRSRYPKNWPEISRRIRFERAQGRCEKIIDGVRCTARHGEPHPITGSKVILTTAHLGRPANLPFFLHVARDTDADKVIDVVGFFMPFDTKSLKWNDMMNARTLANFSTRSPALNAGFFVSLPCQPSGLSPTRSVIFSRSTTPIWVQLSAWSLLGKPKEAAKIAAKSSSVSQIITADIINISAALTNASTESAFDEANIFIAAGRRASFNSVSKLLCGYLELDPASVTNTFRRTFSGSGHDGVLYHFDDYIENCDDNNLMAMCQKCHLRYDQHHHTACDKTIDMFKEKADD